MTYAQRLADQRNSVMTRTDIEWAVGPGGNLYLRDKQSFTAAHTKELEAKAEQERRRWIANHRDQPMREAAE